MNIYAIHREKPFSTEYNVMVYSSKKLAEKKVKELNEAYGKWREDRNTIWEDHGNANFLDWIYNNPTPDYYKVEKIKVITK